MDPLVELEQDALQLLRPIDEATEGGDSEIQRFYRGAVLFITGGTGFLGKQLIEKLFRSCEIRRVYLLVRPKKGKSVEERLSVLLSDPVFESARKRMPDMDSRIVGVEGDMASPRLGISDESWNIITEEVDVIFHVAATVRFDEELQAAIIINVGGTKEALALAKACKNLRSFVHVSTAYCHATQSRVGQRVCEEFHTSPVPADTLLMLARTLDKEKLTALKETLITGWPNTYTFTKAVAEELVHAESGNLPVCVVRPSIVINAYKEPMPGWLDMSCVYGPIGLVLAIGIGLIRVVYVKKTELLFIPVDMVNNATIAAGWQTAVRGLQEPLAYNVVTRKVFFRNLSDTMNRKAASYMTPLSLWWFYLFEVESRLLFVVMSWVLHYLPAYVIDAAIYIFKIKTPKGLESLVEVYKKSDKMTAAFTYFLTQEWKFEDNNFRNLFQNMSELDKIIYNFDVDSIDWDHNSLMVILGIRKYILKDGCKGTKAAAAKQKWYKLANYAVAIVYLAVFWLILNWVIYGVRAIFSYF